MPACSPSITLTWFSPLHSLLYHLWKAFDINFNVGGARGEIVALNKKYGVNLLNPLVTTQNFEYKMSNIFNKPLESTSPNSCPQWRMISPTVGQTAARCLEHYQKLLDKKPTNTDKDGGQDSGHIPYRPLTMRSPSIFVSPPNVPFSPYPSKFTNANKEIVVKPEDTLPTPRQSLDGDTRESLLNKFRNLYDKVIRDPQNEAARLDNIDEQDFEWLKKKERQERFQAGTASGQLVNVSINLRFNTIL